MEFTQNFFIGGLVCLDFCNTFDHLHASPEYDFFPDYTNILCWGKAAKILPTDFQVFSKSGQRSFAHVLETRDIIFRLLFPFTRSDTPVQTDLSLFNTHLQIVSSRMNVMATANGYVLVCNSDNPLQRIECEVVRSTEELLISNHPEQVHQCRGCGWLFYDKSRNHSRRWCTMDICGNRAKAHRHYERVRQRRAATA